jgi:Bacteriocin-protection, YdeI or OmpD-Associated/Domain of unknown function (DUF1905)
MKPIAGIATFTSTLAMFGNNTGIVVPEKVIGHFNAGKRVPVLVNLNGHEYRSTVAVMGGQYLIGVSAAIRKATGLAGGDPITVTLTLATTPREIDIPEDFRACLAEFPEAQTFFNGFSNSLQRMHIDNVNNAKTSDTRQRRIDKAVELFVAGKQR